MGRAAGLPEDAAQLQRVRASLQCPCSGWTRRGHSCGDQQPWQEGQETEEEYNCTLVIFRRHANCSNQLEISQKGKNALISKIKAFSRSLMMSCTLFLLIFLTEFVLRLGFNA